MNLTHILVFFIFAVVAGWLGRGRWRSWVLLVSSILAIYWMQPSIPIRNLDFWLPTFSLALCVLAWAATLPERTINLRQELLSAALIGGTILGIAATRYLEPLCCLIPSRPPALPQVLIALGFLAGITTLIIRATGRKPLLVNLFIVITLGLFLMLKSQPLAHITSRGLRVLVGQPAQLASAFDLRWLGFSYVAFRLLHTLRDRLSGRLVDLSLQEFVTYIIFFPAFTAGPIDRVQRFSQDLRKPYSLSSADIYAGGKRIILGIFNKFVLADSLAIFAINDQNATQTTATPWLWLLIYAYALRIYFDFAGYTDIAIGLGRLLGIQLPENFDRPYLKPNLTTFWNSWHITLAQWFRAYFFNPITRALRLHPRKIPLSLIILSGQLSTMLLIGLWHGISWNFACWGLWHGIGLFIHNRWSEAIRPHTPKWNEYPQLARVARISGSILTFHFVTLGWVWFALPSLHLSWKVFLLLFGFKG